MPRERHHPLFIISGLTCAGKRLLLQHIQRIFPDIQTIITTTDRPKLPHERNGVDHRFVSPKEFAAMQKSGAFVECSIIHGYSYGVSGIEVKRLRQDGPSCIILNPKGATEVAASLSRTNKVYGLFIITDREGIRTRITERSSTQSDLNASMCEIDEELSFITSSCFDLVVNMSDKHILASIGQVAQFIGQKLSH